MTFSYGTSHIDDNSNTEKINNIILDNYIQINNIDKIKIIKIDVEGHEECVLTTMTRSLQQKKFQYIMCEVTRATCRNIINTLVNYGYNKVYDLNTGFVLQDSNLNGISCMDINNILKSYIITDISSFQSRNSNLLFTFDT
jgi:hypothetical protein